MTNTFIVLSLSFPFFTLYHIFLLFSRIFPTERYFFPKTLSKLPVNGEWKGNYVYPGSFMNDLYRAWKTMPGTVS